MVESQRAFANEPLPLGVALNGASGGEMLILVGLAAGTKLSAGTPRGSTGWQVSARELGRTFAYAPKDFVGVMDAAIDLRSANDRLMDSQVVRLEWIWKKPDMAAALAPRRDLLCRPRRRQSLDPEEIAILIKRGQDFLKTGDIPSAPPGVAARGQCRQRAGGAGARRNFDGMLLAELGVLGFASDAPQARVWYQRALELGSSEAARRLDRLADVER